jgi:UDP-N-acetylglucosamine 2-epimerase (non-hydrolysing)
MIVMGTRPEAIKMAPIVKAIESHSLLEAFVCLTAQHRQMLDQVLSLFEIKADADLNLMQENQGLNTLTARIFEKFETLLESVKPDVVLTQGDTTTAFAASAACFHRRIEVGHVEAGLRTYDFERPFPEEMNRRVADLVATYLFAPTEQAKKNLLQERLMSERIFVTGNTIFDALKMIVKRIKTSASLQARLEAQFPFLHPDRQLVLVTGHRRESFGVGFQRICNALARIAQESDLDIVYPVHLNPNVLGPVNRILGNRARIHLIPPLDYLSFVYLLSRATVVLTDSGGVQEEGVSLGKRVLVMRERTERPEGIMTGLAELVGTDVDRITSRCFDVLRQSKETDGSVARGSSVYGDGRAALRIVAALGGTTVRQELVRA